MLDQKQRQWVELAAEALGIAEGTDASSGDEIGTDAPHADQQADESGAEPLDEQQQIALQKYEESLNLLTPQFKRALAFDKGGALRGKINAAVGLAKAGSFLDANIALDNAGQSATALISAQSTEHQQSSDLIGKPLPDRYKNEQFQTDAKGNVMHGGDFRGDEHRRTNYYNEEQQEKSEVRVDGQGRILNERGDPLMGTRGYVVSQDTGTVHAFKAVTDSTGSRQGYDLFDHHSSPIQGGSAAAAGEMTVEDGVLRQVTDQSGHYRPTPEMTHQLVDRLQDEGVAMRQSKPTMLDRHGESKPATREAIELYNEVAMYEHQRQQIADPPPYDPEMLQKKQKLQDLGVGVSNREATVDLTNPKTFVSPDEFEQVKDDEAKIYQLVEQKIGMKLTENHRKLGGGDVSTVQKVNDWIGIISRIAALFPKKNYVDPKKTRLQMTTEQFAQTGGNVDAIRGKEAMNAQIEQRRPADDGQEQQRLKALIESMGGDAKLAQLGVKNPTKLTIDQKIMILSKGRIPEDMQKRIGKPPAPQPPAPPVAAVPAAQPSVSDTTLGAGQPNTEQDPLSYVELVDKQAKPAPEEPVGQAPLEPGKPNTEQDPLSYVELVDKQAKPAPEEPVGQAPLEPGKPNTEQDPLSHAELGAKQTKPAPQKPTSQKLEMSESGEDSSSDEKIELSMSELESSDSSSEDDTTAPVAVPQRPGKELNLKSKRPAPAPHPRQAEYDQLGGDQGLLDKLLPAWKHRNQASLDKLLDLNKRVKTAAGAEKDKLSAAIKEQAAELDRRDRMPTLHLLAGASLDDKLAQLKN